MVLDRRKNPEADTGTFELAYRQVIPKAPAYLGLSLCINGKKLFKKSKERKHENKNAMPVVPQAPSGDDSLSDKDQPVPPEYSGPIITEFLSWLNPYDAIPTNKDGIVLGPREALTVRQAITVVKSGIRLKNTSKKRKSATLSSRTNRGRREKNTEYKRHVVSHSCCRPDYDQSNHTRKYRTESNNKGDKLEINRSVGNKRCYIDPIEWERETASILRSTISVQNKYSLRSETFLPIRHSKSNVVVPNQKVSYINNNKINNDDPLHINKLSAIGQSICKLRDENRTKEKTISFSKSCSSIYAPYRVVVTPLNDEPTSIFLKGKSKL